MKIKILSLFAVSTILLSACTTQNQQSKTLDTSGETTTPVEISSVTTPTTQEAVVKSNSQADTKTTNITMDEVQNHNSRTDCWFVIDDSVYDVTSFMPNHPGGIVIAQGCGKDASVLFHAVEHHQGRAMQMLDTYKVGSLQAN